MARRTQQLTGDLVELLPQPCRGCLFWELGAACPDPRTLGAPATEPADGALSEPVVRKQAWISARVQEGTPPGRVVRVEGEVAGYTLFAPARTFARRRLPTPPASPDTVLLATIWVRPEWRQHGLGRLLLQHAIKDAIRLDAPAVEAYGDRRWLERSCVLPATWLLHEGFEVHREHPRTPILRVDTKRTARWAESFEHAWEEVLGRLPRRVRVPAPEGAGSAGFPTGGGRLLLEPVTDDAPPAPDRSQPAP
jgi:GNAT superfamily N-acetyltransferase